MKRLVLASGLVAFCCVYPSASYAVALYDINLNISVYSEFKKFTGYGFFLITPFQSDIQGDHEGNATETHIKKNQMIGFTDLHCVPDTSPYSTCTSTLWTQITAQGQASKPYGYAWTSAITKLGYNFHTSNDFNLTMLINEYASLKVGTQENGESAYASLNYKLLWDGKQIMPPADPIQPPLPSLNQTLRSKDGVCQTPTCQFSRNVGTVEYNIPITAGNHTFVIDPDFSSDPSQAKSEVPEPLTILGAGVVLGAIPILKKEYGKRNKKKDGGKQ